MDTNFSDNVNTVIGYIFSHFRNNSFKIDDISYHGRTGFLIKFTNLVTKTKIRISLWSDSNYIIETSGLFDRQTKLSNSISEKWKEFKSLEDFKEAIDFYFSNCLIE